MADHAAPALEHGCEWIRFDVTSQSSPSCASATPANAVYHWAAEQIVARRLAGERRNDPVEYAHALCHESWVSCRVLRWKTDFVPPGTVREPDQRLSWGVSQWQWVPEEAEDEDEDAEDAWGEWALRARLPIDASTVTQPLPQAVMLWVRRRTEQAVELFVELEMEGLRSLPRPDGRGRTRGAGLNGDRSVRGTAVAE